MEQRYNTFWPRVVAGIIDGLILLPVSIVLGFAHKAALPIVVYAALVLDYVVFFAYSIYLHGYYGQTIGKWAMKVRVLSMDDSRLTMRQAFLRDSIGMSLAVVYLLFAIGPVFSGLSPDSKEFGERIPVIIFNAGLLAFALEVATMLTNSKRRALHDFIAGSVVVRRSNSTVERDAREDGVRPSP